ncbi:2-hydroxychromene-2-carboxylate isomerase [Novosphingobium pentaromativorans]|uniref:2-hydroxychromene-2-carboxylate isomerase n=1 Tax=Novosphingobium pentaromativorans TaxID=205844 RepID=UPI00068AB8EB|nr:2-hydroxychromene-2-carboxylate isomerase [Novosphingobium pentaromativorans]
MSQAHAPREIEFFFDLSSPFAYMAFQEIGVLAARHDRGVRYRAIDLATAKKAAGNTGPSNREIPPKFAYLRQDLTRWAQRYGVPFAFPDPAKAPARPRDAVLAHHGVAFAEEHGMARSFVAAFWRRSWGEGRFVGDPEVLRGAVEEVGLPEQAFFDYVGSERAAAEFAASTEEACSRGVFGVPTMMCDGQMWWGNDRLQMLEEHLSGRSANDATCRADGQ